ncbi:MAG: BMP family ABC transporter substrate-binding protein, partial [Oscillibacter sp.]|nr:BMP family ABC transporter substrate-binding protein [Oscillibacter sp.]
LIGEGCGLILCDNVAYDADLGDLAAAHPDTFFFSASGTLAGDNLSSCIRRTYQARYLTGLAAGSVTQTGEIGYVLASLTPETIRQLNAFTIGVRKANPDAVVCVRQVNSWDDGEAAASETTALLDARPIDVLSCHTSSNAPLRVADERGVWTVGCAYDNSDLFPDTWLTGCVFNWKPLLTSLVEEWRQGRFIGQRYQGGISGGLVSITPLPAQISAGIRNLTASETERLAEGKYDVFFGPVRDVYGTVQVRQDENMSDEKILRGMYWFVDGVVLE